MTTPELSRPVSVDRLPAALTVEATPAECATLADRLRIPGVASLSCRFELKRRGEVVAATGELHASVTQSCVVSLEPVDQEVRDSFQLRFVPSGKEGEDEDPDSPDEIPYEGSTIDLGEAAAEQLALALDPYPRSPGATLDPAAEDAVANPFAALATFRRPG